MLNYKPKNEVIIEEITREITIVSVTNVKTSVVHEMLSHRRTRVDTPIPSIVPRQ